MRLMIVLAMTLLLAGCVPATGTPQPEPSVFIH